VLGSVADLAAGTVLRLTSGTAKMLLAKQVERTDPIWITEGNSACFVALAPGDTLGALVLRVAQHSVDGGNATVCGRGALSTAEACYTCEKVATRACLAFGIGLAGTPAIVGATDLPFHAHAG